MGVLVLDSSALITLAGAGALSLLALSPDRAVTLPEVYRETVEFGLARGYPDATAISGLFEDGAVTVEAAKRREKLPGIGLTDSLLLWLAHETSVADLLINDQVLRRKAEQRGLPARFTAEFVEDLYQNRKISRNRRNALFETFVANGRYSQDFIHTFLLGR